MSSAEAASGPPLPFYGIFGVEGFYKKGMYPEAGLQLRFHWGKKPIEVESPSTTYTEAA